MATSQPRERNLVDKSLGVLNCLRLSKKAEEIRTELANLAEAAPCIDRKHLREHSSVEILKMDYEEMGREMRINSTLAWVIGTIFISGSLVILGTTVTSVVHPMIQLGPMFLSLILVWSWFWLGVSLSDVNHRRYFLRSHIEIAAEMHRYLPGPAKKRQRYTFAPIPFALHIVWLVYFLVLLPYGTHNEQLLKGIVLIGLLGWIVLMVLKLVGNLLEGVVFSEEKEEWEKDWVEKRNRSQSSDIK